MRCEVSEVRMLIGHGDSEIRDKIMTQIPVDTYTRRDQEKLCGCVGRGPEIR